MGKVKHGLYKHPLHAVRTKLIGRCLNKNDEKYPNYGGRGITVCDEWVNDFKAFYDYVTQLPHYGEDGRSIDRIDNDGNYEPGNIRWATAHEQATNQRTYKNNTSGYVGVRFRGVNKKCVAYMSVNKLRVTVGHYDTIEEAVIARNDYIIEKNLSEYKIQAIKKQTI